MRFVFIVLLFYSFSAHADAERIRQCSSVLKVMTDLIITYKDTLTSCRSLEDSGQVNSRAYEGYKRIARNTESVYERATNLCFEVCDDTFFCEGAGVSGACQR